MPIGILVDKFRGGGGVDFTIDVFFVFFSFPNTSRSSQNLGIYTDTVFFQVLTHALRQMKPTGHTHLGFGDKTTWNERGTFFFPVLNRLIS